MKKFKKNYYTLLSFSGSGSKLLQAQLSNADDVFTIPAYPLMYFPPLFNEWKNQKEKLSAKKILKLIIKHHKSILDSRFIKGFNGLNNLGKNRSGYIKISEKKFKKGFLKFLKKKELSQKNIILAIHDGYQYAINNKSKNILYHAHDIEFFNKFLFKNFENSKILATTRNPIYNFWRRAYSDEKVEKERFDNTDCEYIKNYRYINRLRDLYINFKNLNINFKKKCKFFTFENIKINNSQTLEKVCNFMNIKFNYKKLQNPTFNSKTWWGGKVYKGFNKKKNFVNHSFNYSDELKKFSNYEIFVLEMAMLPFMKKLNFNTKFKLNSDTSNFIKFLFYSLLPTKYGLKLFISRINHKSFLNYIKNTFKESFGNTKIKNYYFNAMYKHKWSYRITYLIKINFFRKLLYKSKKNLILNIFYFFSKILIYPFLQLELICLYFVRIFLLISLYFTVKSRIQYINLA